MKVLLVLAGIWAVCILIADPYRQKWWNFAEGLGVYFVTSATPLQFQIAYWGLAPVAAYFLWLTSEGRKFRRADIEDLIREGQQKLDEMSRGGTDDPS